MLERLVKEKALISVNSLKKITMKISVEIIGSGENIYDLILKECANLT